MLQVAGEVISRLLGFALFAVMVRRLGPDGFGNFTFALSLTALMLLADTAIDDVLTRDVAREGTPTGGLLGDALRAKATVGGAVGALAIAFTFAAGYSWPVRGVVFLLVLGSLAELGITTSYAILRGLGDFRTSTLGLVIMRSARAALGIAALLLGAGLLVVAGMYAVGALLTLGYARRALARRADVPPAVWRHGATRRVVRQAGPLLIAGAVDTLMVSLAPIVLSSVDGAAAVGAYGGALRLALLTQFVGVAIAAAVLPVFARSDGTSGPPLGEMVQVTLKVTTALLLPVTAFLVLFAAPIVTLVYGHRLPGAVEPTRLLAALAVTPAVAMVASVALLARDRLAPLVRVPLVAFAVHVALLAALISPYAENGAAIATLAGEVVYAALMLVAVAGVGGRLSLVRVASGPVAGCVPMVVAAIALGHGAPAIVAALAGYGAVLVLWERTLYPADLGRIGAVFVRRPTPG